MRPSSLRPGVSAQLYPGYSPGTLTPNFSGPSYTIGIEEELMILDPSTLSLVNGIETLLEECGGSADVKPELMESVLEISTKPCPDAAAAGAQLRALRAQVIDAARRRGRTSASAGTPPAGRRGGPPHPPAAR